MTAQISAYGRLVPHTPEWGWRNSTEARSGLRAGDDTILNIRHPPFIETQFQPPAGGFFCALYFIFCNIDVVCCCL